MIHMHNAQDNDIIDLVLKGQQKAFAVLVERYQHYVYTLTLRYIPTQEEAEELAQDAFIKAYNSLSTFNRSSKFSTWLYIITRNTCLSHLRKNNIRFDELNEEHTKLAEDGNNMEHRSEKEQLAKAINMLQQSERIILTLFYLQEQSIQEVSKITGDSVSNVKVKLYRARKRLKEILEQHFKEELTDKYK